MALLLANLGGTARIAQALQLVEQNLKDDPRSNDDLRACAFILMSQPDRRPQAINAPSTSKKSVPSTPRKPSSSPASTKPKTTGPWHASASPTSPPPSPKIPTSSPPTPPALLRQGEISVADAIIRKIEPIERKMFASRKMGDRISPRTAVLQARVLMENGLKTQGASIIRDFIAAHPKEIASVISVISELEKLDPEAAEPIYRELAQDNTQPENLFLLAGFLGRQGRTDEALAQIDAARKLMPPQDARRAIAVAVDMLGSFDPSTEAFRQVESWIDEIQTRDGNTPELSSLRADLIALEGNIDKAKSLYRDVVAANPRDPAALNNLAWLLANTGTPDERKEALDLIQRAIDAHGLDPSLLDTRAIVQLTNNNAKAAEADILQALGSVGDTRPTFLYHLARIQLAAGRLSDARKTLDKAESAGFRPENLDRLERPTYEKTVAQIRAAS